MKNLKYLIPFFVLGLFFYFIDLKELFDQTLFYVFQARDLERARSILNGKVLFFGPEMTGGGNLPGSLYYYLLAFGLKIKNTWISAWYLQVIFVALGILAGFYLELKDKKDTMLAITGVILISSAPLTYRFLQIFLNVSLLIPFCIVSILLINFAFSKKYSSHKNISLYLASFIVGLGLQFHYSIVILMCSIIAMFFLDRKFNLYVFNLKQKLIAILIYILPSIPYYIWSLSHANTNEFSTNSGSAFNALSSLIYLIRFALHSEVDGLFLESVRKILFTFPFFLFFIVIGKLYNKVRNKNFNFIFFKAEYTPLYICMLLSFLPYVDWYLSSQAVRYTMPFYISLNFISLILFVHYLDHKNELKFLNTVQSFYLIAFVLFILFAYPHFILLKFFIPVFVLLIIFSLYYVFNQDKLNRIISIFIFLTVNHTQFITKDFVKMPDYHWALFMPQNYEWKHIWNVIQTYTGWDYQQAKNRIYYIGHHLEQDPELFLEEHKFEPVEKTVNFRVPPDGFFISNRMRVKDSNSLIINKIIGKDIIPKLWIIKQNIQSDVYEAIVDKKIFVGKNLSELILIAPFWIRDASTLPDQIHNIGMGYYLNGDELILQKISKNIGSIRLSENLLLFKANECPSHKEYCSNGVLVKYDPIDESGTSFKITMIGNTISQTSPWINPDWTQAWIKPSIEVECNEKNYNFQIVKSVGFLREGSHVLTSPLLQANNGFVAPIIKTINIPCPPTKIKSISIKREASRVESINQTRDIGSLSIPFYF